MNAIKLLLLSLGGVAVICTSAGVYNCYSDNECAALPKFGTPESPPVAAQRSPEIYQPLSPSPSPPPSPAPTSSADSKVAYYLAAIDNKRGVSAAESDYAALLDRLEPRCKENRGLLGDMTVRSVQLLEEQGKRASNLDMLNGAVKATEPFTDDGNSCADIFATIITLVTSQ